MLLVKDQNFKHCMLAVCIVLLCMLLKSAFSTQKNTTVLAEEEETFKNSLNLDDYKPHKQDYVVPAVLFTLTDGTLKQHATILTFDKSFLLSTCVNSSCIFTHYGIRQHTICFYLHKLYDYFSVSL